MRLCCVFVYRICLTLMSTYFNPSHNLFLSLTTQFLCVDLSKLRLLHKACLLLSPWQQRSNKPSPLGCLLGNTPMGPIRGWRQSSSLSLFISITRQSCRCHCLTHIPGSKRFSLTRLSGCWVKAAKQRHFYYNTFLVSYRIVVNAEIEVTQSPPSSVRQRAGWFSLSLVPQTGLWHMVVTLSLWRSGGHLMAVEDDQGWFSHSFMTLTAVFLWVWVPLT